MGAVLCLTLTSAQANEVATRLPTEDRVIALTFDACQAYDRMSLDRPVIDYLLNQKIPFTLFVSGRFAQDNRADIQSLHASGLVEIENHSWDHPNHMSGFDEPQTSLQVTRTQQIITELTGRAPQFFRFPAGNYGRRSLNAVINAGLHVIHWRFPSGDPDHRMKAEHLVHRTLSLVMPGDILIFHVNGKGVHTAEALPRIVEGLRNQNYRFVFVSDYIGTPQSKSPQAGMRLISRKWLEQVVERATLTALTRNPTY